MSLEQRGLEITATTEKSSRVWNTPAPIDATQRDIRRTGATSVPEALRLAPGLQRNDRVCGLAWGRNRQQS